MVVTRLSFGRGRTGFLTDQACEILVTNLSESLTAARHPSQLGVFGAKQEFLVIFSKETAFHQGVRISPVNAERGIFTIPGGSTIEGIAVVKRISQ